MHAWIKRDGHAGSQKLNCSQVDMDVCECRFVTKSKV